MRLVLLAHAATAAARAAVFATAEEPLDRRGRADAAALAGRLRSVDAAVHGPSRACRDTAGLARPGGDPPVVVEPALGAPDHGTWSGRASADVAATDPAGLAAWVSDPDARPHGGESWTAVVSRVGAWTDALDASAGRVVLAVVEPAVLRAVLGHALGDGPGARRIDVAPLTLATVTGGAGRWRLRSLRPALPGPDDELVAP